jgi:hypothetical protein
MQNTQPVGRPHRNHGLFSDHYLNVTLPARPDWKVDSKASELVDLSSLEIEGLPVDISPTPRQQSKAV